ncbi:unnamed protein product [Rhizoctonia solani]|uniref:N-acetyltransferase domain-containing protein n=1 Tax=Rhizoctonia solani TaxID=456999 RepID=A0A8H3CMD7_9AGAM|nr:unnamed protein product [Rhizoctonia solani]
MSKSRIPRTRKTRTARPKRKLHELEVLADKANKLSADELEEIFKEHLPDSKVDEIEKDAKRRWTFIDGPSLKSTPELKDQVWALFEENMRNFYIQANDPDIPWDPVQKLKELYHPKARLVLVQTPDSLEAFCSFRFEAEEDEDGEMRFLAYIYEIQVARAQRGTGVVMLTCFKCNTQALSVYARLGFKKVEGESETSQEFWKPVLQASAIIFPL